MTGNQAVKEASKPSKANTKGNSDDSEESENEDEPTKGKATKGRKTNQAKKPSSKKKASASVEDSEDENDEADDTLVQRTKGAAKRKTKGQSENNGEWRQTRGKSAPAKRKHEESDNALSNNDSDGGGEYEDEEVQDAKNGKRAKAGTSPKKRVVSTNQKGKQKKKAK